MKSLNSAHYWCADVLRNTQRALMRCFTPAPRLLYLWEFILIPGNNGLLLLRTTLSAFRTSYKSVFLVSNILFLICNSYLHFFLLLARITSQRYRSAVILQNNDF